MYFFSLSLFFFSVLLALTHAVLQDCTSPHTLGLNFFSFSELRFFSPSSLAEWRLYLFLHLFLLFSLSHPSHQVTINASQLIMTLLLFFSSPLAEWLLPLASFFSFFLPTCLTSLTYIFIYVTWLFSLGQATPASSICFADFLPIFQQAHLMS